MIAELAIAWVLLHEYSHWGLAHLSLLSDATRHIGLAEHAQPRMPAFAARPGRPKLTWPDVLISQTLEILADSSAFLLLTNYVRLARGPAARFNRVMTADPQRLHPLVIARIDMFQTVRLCLTAAALACIVLDGYRHGAHPAGESHPSPSARFMNMESQTPAVWPGLLEPGEDAHIVVGGNDGTEFSVRRLAEAIGMASADADLVAKVAATARGRPDDHSPHDPRAWSEQGWRADMRRQWRTGAETDGIDTQAGEELNRLLTGEADLIAELVFIQTEAFGRIFHIRL